MELYREMESSFTNAYMAQNMEDMSQNLDFLLNTECLDVDKDAFDTLLNIDYDDISIEKLLNVPINTLFKCDQPMAEELSSDNNEEQPVTSSDNEELPDFTVNDNLPFLEQLTCDYVEPQSEYFIQFHRSSSIF